MKKLTVAAAAIFATAVLFAGGIDNKSNLNAGYLRNPSRSTEIKRPEAVLLDISMPVCDGITLLGMIRQSETLRDLPVVMYSSDNSIEVIKKIAKYKPNGYVIKPVESQLLAEVLTCAIAKSKPAA